MGPRNRSEQSHRRLWLHGRQQSRWIGRDSTPTAALAQAACRGLCVGGGLRHARRAPYVGQKLARLPPKASSLLWPHSRQRSLRKLWARMPRSRKASNSSLMNRGRSPPVLASVCAIKLTARCCGGTAWSARRDGAGSGTERHRAPAGAADLWLEFAR